MKRGPKPTPAIMVIRMKCRAAIASRICAR